MSRLTLQGLTPAPAGGWEGWLGEAPTQLKRCYALRAIPTCVGTTPASPGSAPASAGHPHVRGDYARGVFSVCQHVGPSPRAWGLLSLL